MAVAGKFLFLLTVKLNRGQADTQVAKAAVMILVFSIESTVLYYAQKMFYECCIAEL
jgi:hypothetical protein